jgi:hypothetical protein
MNKIIIAFLVLLITILYGDAQTLPPGGQVKKGTHGDSAVIMVMADRLRYDAIGKYAPDINELKDNGISFNRAYMANLFGAPSGDVFLTGNYPSSSGAATINGWTGADTHCAKVKSSTPKLYHTMSKNWKNWRIEKQRSFSEDKKNGNPAIRVNWIVQKTAQNR